MNERRKRTHRKGLAMVIGNYHPVGDDWFPSYYLQYARTMGLEQDYDHPNIQALVNFDVEMGHHTVVHQVFNAIQKGTKFKPGDRFTVTEEHGFHEKHTVEFREAEDVYGPCLRAVVLGVEDKFQSLPSEEAIEYLDKKQPGFDPFEYC